MKVTKLTVILFKLKGCKACADVEPKFDHLSTKYTKFDFKKIELSRDSRPLYDDNIEATLPVKTPVVDQNGNVVLAASGKPFYVIQKDENGNVIKQPNYVFPNFFFLGPDDNSDYEFLGNVEGADIEQVSELLKNMQGILNG